MATISGVETDRVLVQVRDNGVATVTLNRADKHNALDAAMFAGLRSAADTIAADPKVRAVVLHGEGRSFCSGLDIASFLGSGRGIGDLIGRDDGQIANLAQRVAYDWQQQPVPVIAAVHGSCFGGGLQIALGADLRIATLAAKLSIMEVKWGLVPDMAITQTLPGIVPLDVAKELTFTGRVVSGSEAKELGLVTRIDDDPFGEAVRLADEIADKSPEAVRAAKQLFNQTWSGNDPAAALMLESELQTALYGSANQLEAVAAGMEQRAPQFSDPV